MKTTPFFSVIIPYYQQKDTIAATLQSVKQQTCQDWECLLVNDGSNDGMEAVFPSLTGGDARFRWLNNTRNKGANGCRNTGMAVSNGQYLIFLDADDMLMDHCLHSRKMHITGREGTALLISGTTAFEQDPQTYKGTFLCTPDSYERLICAFIRHKILWTTTGATWEKCFLSGIGGWNEAYPRLQDVELNIRALLQRPAMQYTGEADSFYRMGTFTAAKQQVALIGFNKLLRDFYPPLITGTADTAISEMYQDAFQDLITRLLRLHQQAAVREMQAWKDYFMETLKLINTDDEDLAKVAGYLYDTAS
ncbi:Glycosyl transferase family 2 [Chitinophaga eiseniae]|uniref:Glycosyl transferase family 2 n=1 Tax=Chitinophaga eiseniae TaxID=634771 RepID=A0A1T4SS59_9BACT|nr:glycosyltransferase family 2 protein [Chitinophaga eiseniae]SKA31075.1 Glycosyl transferase family 2 [Chitinophaga eiseniae]